MRTLIVEGGVPMWFILVLGAVALAGAVTFVVRPSSVQERFVEQITRSTLFSTLVGLAAAIGATFHAASGQDMPHERRIQIAMIGLGESMAPAIVGFGFLTLVTLLVAFGKARLASRDES